MDSDCGMPEAKEDEVGLLTEPIVVEVDLFQVAWANWIVLTQLCEPPSNHYTRPLQGEQKLLKL